MSPDPVEEQRRQIEAGLANAELTLEELWLRYFTLGGSAGLVELEAFLQGILPLPDLERDMLALSVNERLQELHELRQVSYSQPPPPLPVTHGPLAALVNLLEGMRQAPPERLPQLAATAGRAINVDVRIYLSDYDQRWLHPLLAPGAVDAPASLAIDTSLAGRVFRLVEAVGTRTDAQDTLWLPLLDNVERLGVLEVTPSAPTDIDSPLFRQQCRWLAEMVGHLVQGTTQYGDGLDSARRARASRTPAAELIWRLLPPLTAGTDGFVLAGMVSPTESVGGDAFDYALSERAVAVAIFDGMGSGLNAGLLTSAAIAAYRSARRDGVPLFGQAQRVDETVARQFGGTAVVTGILGELDLASGRLRYVNAGHPGCLLMRSGKVVRRLSGGRRAPFGSAGAELTLGEEHLQPGDWLLLHTDGITEARAADGEHFGETRLIDFLEREAAAAHPPPETVRRLALAVKEHQRGVAQQDASVLLARWDGTQLSA